MQKLRRILIPFMILTAFGVICFILYKQQATLDKGEDLTRKVPSPDIETMPTDHSLSSRTDQTVRANRNTDGNRITETSEPASLSTDDLAANPMSEMIAPLLEGVDSLTAARQLKGDGFFEYARHYARKAVAEDPESFEALLFLAQVLPHDGTEREETFRQLFEMDSTSVSVLYGLGQTLSRTKPVEAISYLKAVIESDPLSYPVYHVLGKSYQRLGMYDEALVAHKKAYEISHAPRTLRYIRAIESGNPIIKPLQRESEQRQPEMSSEDMLPQAPLQEETPVTPSPPQRSEPETDPGDAPPEAEKRTLSPEAQQAMEAEFEKLLSEYERMIRGESAPGDVRNQQILDLKRSIESSPNRSDSYLELGRAYEKAGEDKKAAEVYRQARKRFPKDKRFQRTLKDGSRTKRRSESNRSGRARPPQRSDQDKDRRSEDKR